MTQDMKKDTILHTGKETYVLEQAKLIVLFLILTLGTGTAWGQTNITALSQITDPDGHYVITQDITGGTPGVATFNGTLEANINSTTKMPYKITGLSAPLFTTLTGTVKNLVLEDVSISQSGKVGSIACTANGAARIYNVGILSGSVGSTGTSTTNNSSNDCCGGLVGELDGTARVINCYSYADITDGNYVGGIVGYNKVATASNNLGTMVFACMFYGDIKDESRKKAPIYNGTNISNAASKTDITGVSNFNYFLLEAPYVNNNVTFNCALGAEDRFLNRFEFFRHLLNGHRELAGWWATGTYSGNEMLKWVLEPSQLDGDTPYPVLKAYKDQNGDAIKYPSVVNLDKDNLEVFSTNEEIKKTQRNQGRKFGTLAVTIQMDKTTDNSVPYHHPGTGVNEAKITTSSLNLPITDKDPDHFNFNYYKVQLPYYNDVGTKNYNGNRVVTGWKIVDITVNGTKTSTGTGGWSTDENVTIDPETGEITSMPYNFADRGSTKKDLYSVTKRVFNQGAYWDVPEGVSAITIEPYWAKCAYLADEYADVVYKSDMTTAYNVPNVGGGKIYTNGNSYPIAGENQVVFTTRDNAIASSGTGMALFQGVTATNHTVYDYAVVLVGNYHLNGNPNADTSKPYTLTSIDLDDDNEPDYSYIWRFDSRKKVHPVRVDFINIPGLGMAQKSTGGKGSYNFGIMQPIGWFESTNTSLFRVTQFEYDHPNRAAAPYILQGGVMEQWVCIQNENNPSNIITYFHLGGNVWFKEFHRGTHQDKSHKSKHPPVSVTGGDYDEFYLTGLYTAAPANYEDNAECYINGGRFGTVCGAAMEGIGKTGGADDTGNITWQIQNADIKEFYAGGLNAAEGKTVMGNLSTTIIGSHVGIFCGGPKFGDMSAKKTVTTNATNCTFGTFFGAGYGGNSYSREAPTNKNNVENMTNPTWNGWLKSTYTQAYKSEYGGVSTQFSYQFLPMSDNKTNVARIFIEYVKFSLATTHNVTSKLTGCTITGNFYGGGSLGKVDGDVISTLDGCTVNGNVFGAGFSANLPDVVVDAIGFDVEPYYYTALGTYRTGVKYNVDDPQKDEETGANLYAPTTYTWVQGDPDSNVSIDKSAHTLSTPENLDKSNLGSVSGNVTLTLKGNTTVGTLEGEEDAQTLKDNTGNVYGGGDQSYVYNEDDAVQGKESTTKASTTVNLWGNTLVYGNVFGGGNNGKVSGNATVNIGEAPSSGSSGGGDTGGGSGGDPNP